MRTVVSGNRLAIKIGAGVCVGALLGVGACRLAQVHQLNYDFLRGGEIVYTGTSVDGHNRIRATDTLINVHAVADRAMELLRQEVPQAIQKVDEDGNVSFVLPQMEGGRMKIAEYPEQTIQVKPGRLVKDGSKIIVMNESAKVWSHVEIKDFRQPSAVESAMTWLGDRLGI